MIQARIFMKKTQTLLYAFILLPCVAFSQLLPSSVFRESLSSMNPAVVDIEYLQYKLKYNLALTYQEQWMNFSSDPVNDENQFTFTAFADVIPKKSNFIWGMNLNFDQAAALQVLNTTIRGALRVPILSKYHYISVGIGLGGSMSMMQFSKINSRNDVDPLLLNSTAILGYVPRASIGLYYYYYKDGNNSFFGGISMPNTVEQVFQVSSQDTSQTSRFTFSILQHLSAQGGYRIHMGRDFFDISGWVQKAVADANDSSFPMRWNVTAKYHFKDMFWIAGGSTISLRNQSALTNIQTTGSFGFDLPNQRKGVLMQFGCSFSVEMGMLGNYTDGSPEFFFRMAGF